MNTDVTDSGIASIKNVLKAQLQQGVDRGVLASDPAPVVTAPRAADVSPVDKANRLLPDVKFQATIAGAVHAVQIRGIVSL